MEKNNMLEKVAAWEKEQSPHIRRSSLYPDYHLAAPAGWLNDPNGLCQNKGIYHFYFQYSPFDPKGGQKYWGHYESKDFINWTYTGAVLAPDCVLDKDGVYSGSALCEEGKLFLYYTGNVKEEGMHDFVTSGRGANTVLVETGDGHHMGEKCCLMTNKDYPQDLTCHVRDPKVFTKNGNYYMVQGARTKEDKGVVLVFTSPDRQNWRYCSRLQTKETFGYMWECPDLFELEGKEFLSVSPQGLEDEEYRFQNTHQSGYFVVKGDFSGEDECELSAFREWDMGFDFYAPQTFLSRTQEGRERRILVGWSGMIDCEYDNQPAVEQGWQHMLTIPRELKLCGDVIYQTPVEEIKQLRRKEKKVWEDEFVTAGASEIFVEAEEKSSIQVQIGSGLFLTYDSSFGEFSMDFHDASGRGRSVRRIKLSRLETLDIYLDRSIIEVYINGGLFVFTSHFYPVYTGNKTGEISGIGVTLKGNRKSVTCWEMAGFSIQYP